MKFGIFFESVKQSKFHRVRHLLMQDCPKRGVSSVCCIGFFLSLWGNKSSGLHNMKTVDERKIIMAIDRHSTAFQM